MLGSLMCTATAAAAPETWDWSSVNGTNFLTKLLNQHIPHYCGSCWAHGSLSALADRIKIHRRAKFPDIMPAVQVMLNCGGDIGSCFTNSSDQGWSDKLANASVGVYSYVQKHGIPDDTCLSYKAVSMTCEPVNICQNCMSDSWPYTHTSQSTCKPVTNFRKYFVEDYGKVTAGEAAIMAEVWQRGPVSCVLDAAPLDNYTSGVLSPVSWSKLPDHVVSIIGWGVDDANTKYWRVRNSWGQWWGEQGLFRLERGVNALGIEAHCAWATLKLDGIDM